MTTEQQQEQHHKHHNNRYNREYNKDPKTKKSPRMICTVCGKQAVRYYQKHYQKGKVVRRSLIYEHRDEPPIREFIYRGRKSKTYRRCDAGTVTDGLPFVEDPKEEKHPQEQHAMAAALVEESEEKDYLTEMIFSLKELDEISHDISGDESKRILKNIWRWLEERRSDLRRENE